MNPRAKHDTDYTDFTDHTDTPKKEGTLSKSEIKTVIGDERSHSSVQSVESV